MKTTINHVVLEEKRQTNIGYLLVNVEHKLEIMTMIPLD